MSAPDGNLMMVSGDRGVVAGEKGPFHYMLEEFSRRWERIDVIGRRPARRVHEVVFGNVHLHHPDSGRLRTPWYVRSTGLRLARERPYVSITSHDYSPFLNALGSRWISLRTGIPVLSELHHVAGYPRAADARERFDRWLSRAYARWALGWAAGFRVVNSSELPALLSTWGVPRERVHVLPSLYLDREAFHPRASVVPDVDLMFCARLVRNKGVLEALEAARRLVRSGHPDLRLRIVGRGPLESRVDRFVVRNGLERNVERLPWVEGAEELADLYRRSRLLVCASLSEGGPRVAAEAMLCGTPVVATRVGILPEVVRHGENGLLHDGSAEELTRLLAAALASPAAVARMKRSLLEDPPLERYERGRVLGELARGIRRVAAEHRARTGRG